MDHSDDQVDFAQDDDITLQQELMLLKAMAYNNSSTMTDAEYDRLEKEIRGKYADRLRRIMNPLNGLFLSVVLTMILCIESYRLLKRYVQVRLL